MNILRLLTIITGTTVFIAGCAAPELAQSKYTTAEKNWGNYIKRSYPAWNPPKTCPPAASFDPGQSIEKNTTKTNTPRMTGEDVLLVEEPGNVALDLPPLESVVIDSSAMGDGPAMTVEPFPQKISAEAGTKFHTVSKGETLWKIAKKYYGSGAKWRDIYEANRDLLQSPSKVKAGMELVIPSN